MNVISSIGMVYFFALIFPGVIAFTLAGFLFSEANLFDLTLVELILATVFLGFLANTFGHSLGLLYRLLYKKSKDIPFSIFLRSYGLSQEKNNMYRRDTDYWFSIFCFYFNSATIMLLVVIAKVIASTTLGEFVFKGPEPAIAITSCVAGILLYMLSHWTMAGLVKLRMEMR